MLIDIRGLDRAEVLAALYNSTRSPPNGFLAQLNDLCRDMTIEEARKFIDSTKCKLNFDYLLGRPLKISMTYNELEAGLYNRDSSRSAEDVILDLRTKPK